MKKRYLIITGCLLFLYTNCLAQQSANSWSFSVRAGFSIGATTPIGIPATVRKIESYNPGLMLSFEPGAQYHLKNRFGLAAAVRVEQKGMTTQSRVKGYYTTFNEGNKGGSQSVTGYFTGSVITRVKNTYLTVPVYGTYSFNSPLSIKVGGFVSWLLDKNLTGKAQNGYIRDQTPVGAKEEINAASYNFSDEVRTFNAGAEIGADYQLTQHLFASGIFNFAVTPLMEKEFQSINFDLHNLYLNLGVGYRF